MRSSTANKPDRRRPKMYAAVRDGRTIHCTVPEDPDPADTLQDAVRDAISPEAVVAIASSLAGTKTKDARVNEEVRWFCQRLIGMVGTDQYNAILEEIGA